MFILGCLIRALLLFQERNILPYANIHFALIIIQGLFLALIFFAEHTFLSDHIFKVVHRYYKLHKKKLSVEQKAHFKFLALEMWRANYQLYLSIAAIFHLGLIGIAFFNWIGTPI